MKIAMGVLTGALIAATGGTAVASSEHVAGPGVIQGRLTEAAAARRESLARVDAVLSTPEAARAAAGLGLDVRQVRSAAATLSDSELSDIVSRAEALQSDPRAGLSHDVDQLLVIFLIVAIVILVIKAID
jgi:hypothetical protein